MRINIPSEGNKRNFPIVEKAIKLIYERLLNRNQVSLSPKGKTNVENGEGVESALHIGLKDKTIIKGSGQRS